MKKENLFEGKYFNFRRWTGDSFAIFSSIKVNVRIAALVVTYFAMMGVGKTMAQNDSTYYDKKINLEEVEVSARRTSSVYSEVGRLLHVISRKELEALPAMSVQEVLRYAMNVDVRQRGPLGIQADVSIRGGSFDQVMILFNGINVTDPQTGHLSLNLPVDMQSIERIEILEGPGARVYGPGAFSGAINFVTGSKEKNNATLNVLGGEYGLYQAATNVTVNTGAVKHYAAFSKAGSDGYIDNTDFKNHSLFYQGRINLGKEQLDLQVGHNNKEFGAQSFYTPAYPNQFEQNKTTFAALKMTSGQKVKSTQAIYWRRHQDRFELFRDNPASWYTTHNYHLTDVYGGNMNVIIPWMLGKTSLGGEVRSENVWSNVLGEPMDKTIKVPGEDAEFTHSYSRTNLSSFMEHVYSLNRFSVSAGVLINWNSALDHKFRFFPGADVSYWFNDQVKVFGSVNKTLRMPTFTDLFYDGPTNIGNPNLKPEEALTYESGFKYLGKWLNGETSFYYRKADDLIDWGRLPGEKEYTTRNLSELESYGVQFRMQFKLNQLWQQDFLERLDVAYAYIDLDKDKPVGYESVYVMDYLKHKWNLALQLNLIEGLSARINAQYQDREGEYLRFAEGSYEEQPTAYAPYWLTDFRLQYKTGAYLFFAEASNVFDKRYYDLGNVVQPGRWIKGGVKVSFDW